MAGKHVQQSSWVLLAQLLQRLLVHWQTTPGHTSAVVHIRCARMAHALVASCGLERVLRDGSLQNVRLRIGLHADAPLHHACPKGIFIDERQCLHECSEVRLRLLHVLQRVAGLCALVYLHDNIRHARGGSMGAGRMHAASGNERARDHRQRP
jgi:hypothetical protein